MNQDDRDGRQLQKSRKETIYSCENNSYLDPYNSTYWPYCPLSAPPPHTHTMKQQEPAFADAYLRFLSSSEKPLPFHENSRHDPDMPGLGISIPSHFVTLGFSHTGLLLRFFKDQRSYLRTFAHALSFVCHALCPFIVWLATFLLPSGSCEPDLRQKPHLIILFILLCF